MPRAAKTLQMVLCPRTAVEHQVRLQDRVPLVEE
jgi:hypothetical protein